MPPIYSHLLSSFYGRRLLGSEKKEAISLSYLFLLRALLELSSHTKKIERIAKSTQIENHVTSYLQRCTEMLFSTPETMLGSSPGLINRIFFYFEILIQNQEIPPHLQSTAKSVFKKMKKRLEEEKLKLFVETAENLPPQQVIALSLFLKENLIHLFSIIADGVKDHLNDENILYLLVKFRKRLNDIVDRKTIEEMLKIAFPGGFNELKAFVIKKYQERGFAEVFKEEEEPVSS